MQGRSLAIWTFAVTSVALVMVVLDNLVVSTALNVIREELGATVEQLEWTVNAYTLTFAVFLLTGAALGDRFGRRRMFVIGVAIFTAASAFAAMSTSVEMLLVGRMAQGIGARHRDAAHPDAPVGGRAPERRGVALGAWGAVGGLAVALGPLVGGAIVEGVSWNWIFWINVPIGIALVPFGWFALRESHGPAGRLDLPGRGARERRPAGRRLGPHQRQQRGLDEPDHRGRLRHRRGLPGRLRGLGAARAGAHAAAALLPGPLLQPGQRVLDAHELRDVRLHLPAGQFLQFVRFYSPLEAGLQPSCPGPWRPSSWRPSRAPCRTASVAAC